MANKGTICLCGMKVLPQTLLAFMPRPSPIAPWAQSIAPQATIPHGKQGVSQVVEFTVIGIPCVGLNGGHAVPATTRHSRFRSRPTTRPKRTACGDAIVRNGGQGKASAAGVEDKWGVSWQIPAPRALIAALSINDPTAAKRVPGSDDANEKDGTRRDRGRRGSAIDARIGESAVYKSYSARTRT